MFTVYAESGCYNPDWDVSQYQYSLGATQFRAAQSVQECLDYCGSQAGCVAVSVDMTKQPPGCWPHLSAADLLPLNVRAHRGFNQYRLRERCATGPVTGSLLNCFIGSDLFSSLRINMFLCYFLLYLQFMSFEFSREQNIIIFGSCPFCVCFLIMKASNSSAKKNLILTLVQFDSSDAESRFELLMQSTYNWPFL